MSRKPRIFRSPSTLRIRLSRHLAFQYLVQAAVYAVLVLCWLYYFATRLWDRIGPYSGGRVELPKIALLMIAFGPPLLIWFLYTILFLQKPLRYLDDLLGATAQLASDKEQPIVLPAVMKEAENELNEVRLQSILDERMLLENEEKKNNLIMYLAHDLKTPLTSVMGYLALLEENPDLPAEQRAKYTGIARAKAERLEELIGEFFDITRLTLTTMTVNRAEVNLSRMLEQIVSESAPLLEEKGIRWKADIERDVFVSCDADKMQRVFDNLIRNAVSYARPAGRAEAIRADIPPAMPEKAACGSTFATAARQFPKRSSACSSSSSTGWMSPEGRNPAAVPASALPLPKKSWNCTAEPSRQRARTRASPLEL